MFGNYLITALLFTLITIIYWILPNIIRPTLPFGVRIPLAEAQAAVIGELRRRYRILLLLVAVLDGAVTLALTLTTDQPAVRILTIAPLAVGYWGVYYYTRRQLQSYKAKAGWFAGQHQVAMAEVAVRSWRDPLSWSLALLAVGVIVVTTAVGIWRYPQLPEQLATRFDATGIPISWVSKSVGSAFMAVWIQLALTFISGALALFAVQMKQEIDVEDPIASLQQQRQFRQAIGRSTLLVAVGINLTELLAALLTWGLVPAGSLVSTLLTLPVLVSVVVALVMIARVNRTAATKPGAGARPGYVNRDDDRYWVAGIFYVNHDDPAILVSRRFGIGLTLNFARPAAWLVMSGVLGAALLIFLLRQILR